MANKAIRGITVEIGGDTTKLGKAIEGTEKKSRSLQVELRQIEKLLKFDPTNTELLAQKQEVLKKAISETANKLDTLKEAEKQVVEQFERGEIAEEQLRAFQREIIQTEKDLTGLKTELSSTEKSIKNLANGTDSAEKHTDEYKNSVDKAKKELAEFKTKADEAFETLKTGAKILGGAVVATGGYALKLSTDFDKAFNTLITRTGASKDEIDELNSSMENIYANNFGESIEDVAVSMATVKQNTKLSGKELESATEKALLMRDTFEFDVNESTRSAKMLMDQYGISAEDAYNLIAQGAQNGLDKNGDLLDTINEYAVHFNHLGLDAEDMFNMLVNSADSGTFSVDKLGDAVKEFSIRAIDGSDSTAEGFKAIGLNADQMAKKFGAGGESAKQALSETAKALFSIEDPIAQNTAGVNLFGTMWEDLGVEGVKALMNLDGEIATTNSALEDINNQKYDDIGSAIQGLGRTLETEVISPLGDELKPFVEELIDKVKANAPEIKEILKTVVENVGEFVTYIVDHGPTVIATLAGIGAGMMVWKVASLIKGVVDAVKAYQLANEGATIAQAIFNAVLNANPLMLIVTVITAVIVAIVAFIATNDKAREKLVEIWKKIKEVTGKVIEALAKFFTETIPKALDKMVSWFKSLPEKIKTWLSNTLDKVKNWASNMTAKAKETGSKVVSSVVTWFSKLPGKIWTWLLNVITKVVTWGNNLKSKAVSAITSLISGVYNNARQLPSKIWSAIQGAISRVKSWGSSLASTAKSAISTMITNVVNTAKSLPGKFLQIGKDIINGIKKGISSAVSGLYSSIKSSLSGLVDKAKKALGINSPSKVFANVVGKAIPEGIAKGVDDNTDIADNAVQDLTDDITDQALNLNGATINRKLAATFNADSANINTDNSRLLSKLDSIYERLNRLQIVLDTGALVGETIDKIDAGLADRQLLSARGV